MKQYLKIEYASLLISFLVLGFVLFQIPTKPVVTDAPTIQTDTVAFKDGVISFKLSEMRQGVVRELYSDKLKKDLTGKQFSIDSSNPKYAGLSAYVVLFEPKDKLNHLAPYIDVGIVKK